MPQNKGTFIYGAGGLGREMKVLLSQTDNPLTTFDGFITTEGDEPNNILSEGDFFSLLHIGVYNNPNIMLAIGDPVARLQVARRIIRRAVKTGAVYFPLIKHPSVIAGHYGMGEGVIVQAGCILTSNVHLGDFSFLNLNCTVGHDCFIGDATVVNPGCNISGNVSIGEACLIGTGATILQGVNIGACAKIGAGAIILKDVPPDTTAVGVWKG